MKSPDETPLVPLRVEGGWVVKHNQLRDIDPVQLGPSDERWSLLKEDLLQLKKHGDDLLLDVGWYPDQNPTGEYGIMAIVEGDWDHPIAEFATRSLGELVTTLETMLRRPPAVPSERLIARLDGLLEQRCSAAEELARRGDVSALDAIRAALARETIPAAADRLNRARDTLIAEKVRTGSSS
jgi:hypothetical protein